MSKHEFCPDCGRPQVDCSDAASCEQYNEQRKEFELHHAKVLEWNRIIKEVGYIGNMERDFALKIARAYPNPPTK